MTIAGRMTSFSTVQIVMSFRFFRISGSTSVAPQMKIASGEVISEIDLIGFRIQAGSEICSARNTIPAMAPMMSGFVRIFRSIFAALVFSPSVRRKYSRMKTAAML